MEWNVILTETEGRSIGYRNIFIILNKVKKANFFIIPC